MVTKELSEAAVEFNCILDNSSQEIINKIPQKFIDYMKNIASQTYKFNYDTSKSLNEQKLKFETRGLIALVYQDYLCNKEEKEEYILKCKNYESKKEKELREKYNPDNIFSRDKYVTEKLENEEKAIVKYKKINFIHKLINRIKVILKKS